MKLERGMQLGETYFKRSWAERAPGPPANSGDYEDGQALPTQGEYLRPGLKLSVRQVFPFINGHIGPIKDRIQSQGTEAKARRVILKVPQFYLHMCFSLF